MQRRKFLQNASYSALLLLANGSIRPASATDFIRKPSADRFRFAVTSDGHYGENRTNFVDHFDKISQAINSFHKTAPLRFAVANGDLFHDDPAHFNPAAEALKKITPPLYVTKGNHDRVTHARWEEVWEMGVNHAVTMDDNVLLFGVTADEKGAYHSPDVDWFEQQLKKYSSARNIFIFCHITPVKWTTHGIDAKAFQTLIKGAANIRAVFNGHDHDQDGIKMLGSIPFLFDGHFGGSWGTSYRGFRVVEILDDNSLLTYMMDPIQKMPEIQIYNDL